MCEYIVRYYIVVNQRSNTIMAQAQGGHFNDIAFFARQEYITAIDSIREVRHNPRFGIPLAQQTVEFIIPKSPEDFIDFKHSDLYCKVRVVKKDRTGFTIATHTETRTGGDGKETDVTVQDYENAATEFAYPINLLFHTMWKSCDIIVQHNTVSSCGTFYPYKAAIDTLVETTIDEKDMLYTEGYYHDEGNLKNYHPWGGVRGSPYAEVNKGTMTRYRWCTDADKGILEMKGPLRTDIWNSEHLMLNNIDITVKLEPSSEAFRLCWNPSSIECELEFLELALVLRRVRLNKKVLDGVNAGLSRMPAQYPHKKSDIRMYQIPAGSFNKDLDDIWQNQVPSKVIAVFVDAEAFNGSRTMNPINFENCNITEIGIQKDYECAIRQPFKLNFEKNIFIEAAMALWRITCKEGNCRNIGISKEDFKRGCALFCFDIDPSVPYDLSYWGPVKKGNMKLHIEFGEAGTSRPLNLLLYAMFPGTVQLDSARSVVRDSPAAGG